MRKNKYVIAHLESKKRSAVNVQLALLYTPPIWGVVYLLHISGTFAFRHLLQFCVASSIITHYVHS